LRSRSSGAACVALVIAIAGASPVSAHRRDELLQAARVGIAADRIELELSLTPGIAVADDVIGAIDRDGNGVLSTEEQRDYGAVVLAATELRIDGTVVKMGVVSATFPAAGELTDGDRSIELRSAATLPALSSGRHEIVFTNGYRSDISVYLANALKPDSERIVIASQHRDPAQRTLAIHVTIDGGRFATLPVWLFGSGGVAWLVFRRRTLPAIG
jgi:hypothetical protein